MHFPVSQKQPHHRCGLQVFSFAGNGAVLDDDARLTLGTLTVRRSIAKSERGARGCQRVGARSSTRRLCVCTPSVGSSRTAAGPTEHAA